MIALISSLHELALLLLAFKREELLNICKREEYWNKTTMYTVTGNKIYIHCKIKEKKDKR